MMMMMSKYWTMELNDHICIFSVTHKPDFFTQEIEDKFVKIWSISSLKDYETESPMHRLLSPRNIMLLAESHNSVSWLTLGKLFKRLLQTKLLDAHDLSDQCIRTFFRQTWPVVSARVTSQIIMI